MNKFFLFTITLIFITSCSNPQEVIEDQPLETSTEIPSEPIKALELVPLSYLEELASKTTGIEATMYQSAASFSMWDNASVVAFLKMITPVTPKELTTNKIGHIMFLENGNSLLIAYVYDNGVDVFIKIENDGNTYYNILNGKAKDMFTNVKVQAKEQAQ